MKITETITRDCCNGQKDLVRYEGAPKGRPYWFCKHCGRQWENTKEYDGAGNSTVQTPLPWPWEQVNL